MQWQHRVADAAAQFRRAAQRFAATLRNDIPRATQFLADRITALEAYYATQALAVAGGLAATGVHAVMGGVIGAIRRSRGELNRAMGSVGEQISAQVFSKKFGLREVPFDQPKHGFDRVFSAPGMPLVVAESKVSSSGQLRLGQTRHGQQGSPEWVRHTAHQMGDRSSAQWSPANERIARMVGELGPENVPTTAVVINPDTGLADVCSRQGGSGWRLLDGDISIDKLSE